MHFNTEVFTRLSGLTIQLHWASAVIAFFLGAIVLLRPRKGDRPHRWLGGAYAALMLFTAGAAFLIRHGEVSGWAYLTPAGMTWIHLFIPLTLFGVIGGLHAIFARQNRKSHKWSMLSSYLGALVIAGAFTFIPGRRMHSFFFAPPEAVAERVGALETETPPPAPKGTNDP